MKLYPALVALLLCSSLQAQNIIHTQRYAPDNQKAEMGKVVLVGINDIAQNLGDPYSEDNTLANIQSMTELARLHGARVILCSVL